MQKGNFPQLYAPTTIDQVVGHATVIADIKKRAAGKRWPSVFFLTGPTGTGKTTLVRILEKYLTCEKPAKDGSPCNKCKYCVDIDEQGFSLAVKEYNASNIGIDEMRKIELSTKRKSITSPRVVYFIDELQELAGAGGSPKALKNILTMLERATPDVFFILGAMEDLKLPLAVKDRTATYRLKPIPFQDIAAHLKMICETKEEVKIDTQQKVDTLLAISEHCQGSMRGALKMLERCVFGNIWDEKQLKAEFGVTTEKSLRAWLVAYLQGDVTLFEEMLPVEYLDQVIKMLELAYKEARGVHLQHWEANKLGIVKAPLPTLSVLLDHFYLVAQRPYLTPTMVTIELLRAQEKTLPRAVSTAHSTVTSSSAPTPMEQLTQHITPRRQPRS